MIGAGALAYFIFEIKSKLPIAQEKTSAHEEITPELGKGQCFSLSSLFLS
jgi:hypothetical protein